MKKINFTLLNSDAENVSKVGQKKKIQRENHQYAIKRGQVCLLPYLLIRSIITCKRYNTTHQINLNAINLISAKSTRSKIIINKRKGCR